MSEIKKNNFNVKKYKISVSKLLSKENEIETAKLFLKDEIVDSLRDELEVLHKTSQMEPEMAAPPIPLPEPTDMAPDQTQLPAEPSAEIPPEQNELNGRRSYPRRRG